MTRLSFSVIFILLACIGNSQSLKVLKPSEIEELDFSLDSAQHTQEEIEACEQLRNKMDGEGRSIVYATQKERKILSNCGYVSKEAVWSVFQGCSWYCGGGPKKVIASSALKSQRDQTFKAANAHDLKYNTAWAVGSPAAVFGSYLEYYFEPTSPRINRIRVVNGDVKTTELFNNHGRVKKIKMYIDNKPYAILELNDQVAIQNFDVDPIGNREKKKKYRKPWKLKFEVLEVYPGNKYQDVAITELFFDGLDVHCLGKGSRVLMFDRTFKNIEALKLGDEVATLDFSTNQLKPARVEKLARAVHHDLVSYRFKSGNELVATQDHPFRLIKKGWASLQPEKSMQYKGFEHIEKIKTGDLFLTATGIDELVSITNLQQERETYTISKLSVGTNFVANGMVVGVEE